MRNLVKFLGRYKKQTIIGPIFKLIEAVFELIIPVVMSKLIDNGINRGDISYVAKMSLVMIGLAFFGLCSALVCQYSASIASQGFGTDLRNALFEKIGTFSHAELDKFGSSSLTNRITNDVNQLQVGVAMLIRLAIRAPFLIIGGIISVLLIDPTLALVPVAAMIIVSGILYFTMTRSVRLYQGVQEKLDKVALGASEALGGIRSVRAFDKTEDTETEFSETATAHSKAFVVVSKLSAFSNPASTLVMNLAIIGIIFFGGMRVSAGDLTQGEIVAFINYMQQILLALAVFANLVIIFSKALASGKRVSEVLTTEPSVCDSDAPLALPDKFDIEFKNVSFSYGEGGEKVLSDISFTAAYGETVGVLGLTGSGKSTLMGLISRFYDATQGEILINGRNIKEYSQKELRRKIGVVSQAPVLFSGTVASNLRFGNGDITDEDMVYAAEVSQSYDFIMQKEGGFDSEVSARGKNFSGGQRQRLAIARAVAMRPSVLILDDASSALDFATEAALKKAIKERVDSTVFIVSQRVSSVFSADKIIVLDDGRISAAGTHDELLSSSEIYREIYSSQTSEDGDDGE